MVKKTSSPEKQLRQIILDFPKQFSRGTEAADLISFPDEFNKVIVCAMGGSALPGDVLRAWLNRLNNGLALEVYRNYSLPRNTDQKTLIICISYSGNTEETISGLKEALKRNLKVAAIGSGGKLEELCKENNVPFAKVPLVFMPRFALGYQFVSLVKILINSNLLPNDLKEEAIGLEKKLDPMSSESQGKEIAKKLKNKIPVIYSSRDNLVLARILKINLNENSKVPAFFNYFPELNHNELAGFTFEQKDFQAIMLRDKNDLKSILQRMEITAKLLMNRKVGVEFIEIDGETPLVKIFSNILLGEWISYYLAKEKKVDPISIDIVEELKKELAD